MDNGQQTKHGILILGRRLLGQLLLPGRLWLFPETVDAKEMAMPLASFVGKFLSACFGENKGLLSTDWGSKRTLCQGWNCSTQAIAKVRQLRNSAQRNKNLRSR